MLRRITTVSLVLSLVMFALAFGPMQKASALTATVTSTPCGVSLTVTGKVSDASGVGIAGATVIADTSVSHPFSTTTAADGTYTLSIPVTSNYACLVNGLRVTAAGYNEASRVISSASLRTQSVQNFTMTSGNATITSTRTPAPGCGTRVVVTSTPSPTFTPTPRTATATPTTCGPIYITATPSGVTLTPTPTLVGDIGYRTVSGKVTNSVTGAAVSGATVTCSHFAYNSTGTKCVGTTTTATDGSYSFGSIFIHDTDSITIGVQAVGYTTQSIVKGGTYFLASSPVNFALVASSGSTFTPTPSATITRTPTSTPFISPTPVVDTFCAPATAVTTPFTKDGAGTFCWQISTISSYINSWNTTSVTIGGNNYTNLYVTASSLPAKTGGYWYIGYTSSVAWGHFEAK